MNDLCVSRDNTCRMGKSSKPRKNGGRMRVKGKGEENDDETRTKGFNGIHSAVCHVGHLACFAVLHLRRRAYGEWDRIGKRQYG